MSVLSNEKRRKIYRLTDDICTIFNWSDDVASSTESVVDDERDARGVCDLSEQYRINHWETRRDHNRAGSLRLTLAISGIRGMLYLGLPILSM